MNHPLVHVLVINWNGKQHLRECFDSLLESTYPNARYVLIDNASEDGSVDFVRERYGDDPRVAIVQCEMNLGWSGGNNVGMERALAAGADYVFLLNNDTVTAPDALERLVEMAESREEIGALAPKMLLYDNPDLLNSVGVECSIIGAGWDIGLGRLDGPKWNEPRQVLAVCGGACMLRSKALRRTGLLPDDYQIYLDDVELCLRIWNAGFEVWTCPAAVVRHKFGATMGQRAQQRRKYYLNTRNRFRLVVRNFPMSKFLSVKLASLRGECKAIGRALLDGENWRVLAHLRAWLSTWAYLPKAVSTRIEYRRRGIHSCRFWHLIRKDRLFFPGVEFPEEGWYLPQVVAGIEVKPMSVRARCGSKGGKLRFKHPNKYPLLGSTLVDIMQEGACLGTLTTQERDETIVETRPGYLELVARHVFDADETGECVDLGGWIAIEQL